MIKIPSHRALGPQLAGAEQHPNLGHCAIHIIGQTFNDQSHIVGGEALVAELFIVHCTIQQTCTFFNGALQCVFGHRGFFGLLNCQPES